MRRMILLGVLGLTACDVLDRDDEHYGEQDEPVVESWRVHVFEGAAHVGTQSVDNWPPPLGECIEGDFVLDTLPEHDVGMAFEHAGDRDVHVELNGEVIIRRVKWQDLLGTAFTEILVDISVCSLGQAFGEDDCEEIEVDLDVVFVNRAVPEDLLGYGLNTYRLCATDGDFVVADGLRLFEYGDDEAE